MSVCEKLYSIPGRSLARITGSVTTQEVRPPPPLADRQRPQVTACHAADPDGGATHQSLDRLHLPPGRGDWCCGGEVKGSLVHDPRPEERFTTAVLYRYLHPFLSVTEMCRRQPGWNARR